MKKEKKELCSEFELMLLWTSYRYCIGRHSYVVSMAYDMAQNYYDKMSDERMVFTANDIRESIMSCLRFSEFNFNINRTYSSDEFNPLGAMFRFFDQEDIRCMSQLAKVKRLEYDANTGKYTYELGESNFKSLASSIDFDDLIPWESLASLFDKPGHKTIKLIDGSSVEAFKSWRRKTKPCKEKPGWFQNEEFGWEEIWVPVKEFVAGKNGVYIPEENIIEIN